MLLPDFVNILPCWLAQFWWDSQQGRELAKSGSNKKKIQFCQSYSYVNRKVWYHQIWIPNNLGFMVLILTYPPFLVHLVIERPLEPCCRPDEKWSSVKASGGHAAFFSSDLLIFLCTVPYEPDMFWQKKNIPSFYESPILPNKCIKIVTSVW